MFHEIKKKLPKLITIWWFIMMVTYDTISWYWYETACVLPKQRWPQFLKVRTTYRFTVNHPWLLSLDANFLLKYYLLFPASDYLLAQNQNTASISCHLEGCAATSAAYHNKFCTQLHTFSCLPLEFHLYIQGVCEDLLNFDIDIDMITNWIKEGSFVFCSCYRAFVLSRCFVNIKWSSRF